MIDKLVMRCEFRHGDEFNLPMLGLPRLEGSIDDEGVITDMRHPWESIPSSYSGLAFKVFDYDPQRKHNPDAFLEIKASPAKLLHGHNVYGSDDLLDCAMVLIEVLFLHYPQICEHLYIDSWDVAECDITYHSWADSETKARQFINALQNVSRGQTVSRGGYDGTCYFGKKNSRLKKIKVYDKYHEILSFIKNNPKKADLIQSFYPVQLLDWCKGMIRWEVTLKKRWFERRGINTKLRNLKDTFNAIEFWKEATTDIMQTLEGHTMKIINDETVLEQLKLIHQYTTNKGVVSYSKAFAAYRTYRAIVNEGYKKAKESISKPTFHRHLTQISAIGLSRSYLQQQQGEGIASNVVPLVRYAVVEFRQQYPDFYKKAA